LVSKHLQQEKLQPATGFSESADSHEIVRFVAWVQWWLRMAAVKALFSGGTLVAV
jgi:hypothetical protein